MINPVSAAYLQSFFPLPTTAGLVNNFAANDVDQVNREQFNIRVDYARPKDQIFGRFSLNNSTLSLSRGTFNSGALPGFGDNDVINTRNFVLADDHTFNPSTVLDLCLVRAFRVNALYRFAECPYWRSRFLTPSKAWRTPLRLAVSPYPNSPPTAILPATSASSVSSPDAI